jgi:hypothetical protein
MGVALITGASSGLGLEFANLFAKDGHSLILVARRKDLLEKVALDAKALDTKIKVHIIDMDLGTPGAGSVLFQKVSALGIQVDYLVNNAGFGTNGIYAKLPLDRELQMVDLNVRTLIELTHLFLPNMLAKKSGRILNVGSTAGFQCGPYMATYFATKAFVNSWSEALNEELLGTGVACTVLAPGATRTEFAKAAEIEKSKLFTWVKQASARDTAIYGYKSMWRGRGLAVHGVSNNFMLQLLRLTPRWLTRKITALLCKQLYLKEC